MIRTFIPMLGFIALNCSNIYAQPYPSKSISLIVPFAPGGATDLVGRSVGRMLSESLKQNVIIDNRPGAGGVIGATFVAKSP